MQTKKWYSLADKVWDPRNLAKAAAAVLAHGGAPGIDHVSCDRFAEQWDARLDELAQALRAHPYHPLAVQRVYIPQPGTTKQRPLGIPAVRDRVVQQALRQVLEPIWDPTFSPNSYGFRPGRSAHDAVSVIYDRLLQGYHWVVDADIQAFFDSIDHETLLDRVADRISDGTVLRWLREMLTAGVLEDGTTQPTLVGTPQGGVMAAPTQSITLSSHE